MEGWKISAVEKCPSKSASKMGSRSVDRPEPTIRLLKNGFHVILNEVKDLELINITRFFAALRMTKWGNG